MQFDKEDAPVLELRSDVPGEARALIEQWLYGQVLVASYYPAPESILTVARDVIGLYHVTYFFRLGPRWAASADAQGVSADQAFRELTLRLNN